MDSKLIRQLRREVSRSPKKAVILGLLLLLACYAWAPLALKWMRSESPQSASAPQVALIAAAPGLPVAGEALRWQDVAHWLDSDSRKRPHMVSPNRNPFVRLAMKPNRPEPEMEVEPPAEVSPAELGLVLASTVVGSKRRTALINGRVYVEGREVTAASGDVFVIIEVAPRRIVLRRGDREYELAIAAAAPDDGPKIQSMDDR